MQSGGHGCSTSCSGDFRVSTSECLAGDGSAGRINAIQIDVNGTRLWFDVDGPALVPGGSEMRQAQRLCWYAGGPGTYDHWYFKPDVSRLSEHAQVVYLDLRGHGRSDWGDAATWRLETCADDIRTFCELGPSLGESPSLERGIHSGPAELARARRGLDPDLTGGLHRVPTLRDEGTSRRRHQVGEGGDGGVLERDRHLPAGEGNGTRGLASQGEPADRVPNVLTIVERRRS
jgi:hypothetical protein